MSKSRMFTSFNNVSCLKLALDKAAQINFHHCCLFLLHFATFNFWWF